MVCNSHGRGGLRLRGQRAQHMGVDRAGFKVPVQRPAQRRQRLGAPGHGRFQIDLTIRCNRLARSRQGAFPQIRSKGRVQKNQVQTARCCVPQSGQAIATLDADGLRIQLRLCALELIDQLRFLLHHSDMRRAA